MKRPSIMALSPSLLHYFWKSMPDLAAPDLQGVFTPASYKEGYVGMLDDFPGMTTGIWQHRPDSRGQVRICSADPLRDPLILANYLEDERDQQTLVRGMAGAPTAALPGAGSVFRRRGCPARCASRTPSC